MTTRTSAATNLIAGTLTRYGAVTLNIVIGLFLMPFTVAHLGKSQYGLWMLAASVTYYFSLLDLGYGGGLVRHIVEADARKDVAGINRIVSTFVCVYAGIGLLACGVTAALIVFAVPHFPHLTDDDIRTARVVLAILGLRVAIGFPMTVFGAITTARQGFVLNNSISMVMIVLNAIVTCVVLTSGGGLTMLVFWTTVVSLTGYFGYAWSARTLFPELRIRAALFSRGLWRDVTAFSLYLFAIDVAMQVTFNVDNVLIGAFLGTSSVAIYAVALRLSEYQRRLCDQFSGMLFPVAVGLGAEGSLDRLRTALVEGTRVAAILVVGVTICLVGFGRPLIDRWMGPGFDGTVPAFQVLAIVSVVLVTNASQSSILLAMRRHKLVASVWLIEAIANFALSLLLIRPFGSVGVALGTAIPILIGHLGVLTPAACRQVGLPLHRYVIDTAMPAAVGAVPATAFCAIVQTLAPASSLRMVMVEGAATGSIYLVTVVWLGLDVPTRRRYVEQLRRVMAMFRPMQPHLTTS